MKSNTMIYVDKILDIYTTNDSRRQVHIFEKVDANNIHHYGCRYYENQEFKFDEFYPNKSLHYAESAGENWINNVKND